MGNIVCHAARSRGCDKPRVRAYGNKVILTNLGANVAVLGEKLGSSRPESGEKYDIWVKRHVAHLVRGSRETNSSAPTTKPFELKNRS